MSYWRCPYAIYAVRMIPYAVCRYSLRWLPRNMLPTGPFSFRLKFLRDTPHAGRSPILSSTANSLLSPRPDACFVSRVGVVSPGVWRLGIQSPQYTTGHQCAADTASLPNISICLSGRWHCTFCWEYHTLAAFNQGPYNTSLLIALSPAAPTQGDLHEGH